MEGKLHIAGHANEASFLQLDRMHSKFSSKFNGSRMLEVAIDPRMGNTVRN